MIHTDIKRRGYVSCDKKDINTRETDKVTQIEKHRGKKKKLKRHREGDSERAGKRKVCVFSYFHQIS